MNQTNASERPNADFRECRVAGDLLIKQFEEQRPLYEAFTNRIRTLLGDLLDAAAIRSHLIEGRTKDATSLWEKICRPGKSYGDSISEIPDLSGLRIISYYIDDIERIADLIKREFKVDLSQSADKRDLLEENEFGYLSLHFIIELTHDVLLKRNGGGLLDEKRKSKFALSCSTHGLPFHMPLSTKRSMTSHNHYVENSIASVGYLSLPTKSSSR